MLSPVVADLGVRSQYHKLSIEKGIPYATPHDNRMTANRYLSELESPRFANIFRTFSGVVYSIL